MVGLATVFGAGGGTSSYAEVETANVIIMWGSNAREAHPIFFHHVLKAINNGAQLFTIDPRRTTTAAFGKHLQLHVGTDIALAYAIGREIIVSELNNAAFINSATTGFAEYREAAMEWTLEKASAETGVDASLISDLAHAYAGADRAQLCWTLGITEHHNAVDNVVSLINLALLTGHVGRHGSGLSPLRGQNNVQGGGDMGAIPNRFVGFQDILDPEIRAKFEAAYGRDIMPQYGWHLTQMFEAMERGDLRSAYVIGENPAQSEADVAHTRHLLTNLDHLVVQDIFLTKTAELADVVLPAAAAWCESAGTVTNSERRVQRVRKAVDSPGEARDDMWIILEMARLMGAEWNYGGWPRDRSASVEIVAEAVWDELRPLSPMHHGMSYERIANEGGLQWPCPSDTELGPTFLHGRLWATNTDDRGRLAPFSVVRHELPVDECTPEFPIRLTTGRRLDSYNTGVQSASFASPLRFGETIDVHPADAAMLGVVAGDMARVSSRRGAVEAPVRLDEGLRPGLAFMTFHFPEQVDVNLITIEAADPRSGTSEFKATAVRIEKVLASV